MDAEHARGDTPRSGGVDDPEDGWFPESVAASYDAPGGANAPEAVLAVLQLLEGLADGGPVLEFAVGTGRIAGPLARRGLAVSGIELSRAMAARLSNKPGGAQVNVTIGDIAKTRVAGEFSLVYLVDNTICNVLTQDAQVEVFCNAAAHLVPGGHFLIEVGVPDLRRLPPGQDTVPFALEPGDDATSGYVGLDRYDVATQAFSSNHLTVSSDGQGRWRTIPFRYVWPSELDLMARIAGMTLCHRFGDWERSGFTATSTKHISIWEKR